MQTSIYANIHPHNHAPLTLTAKDGHHFSYFCKTLFIDDIRRTFCLRFFALVKNSPFDFGVPSFLGRTYGTIPMQKSCTYLPKSRSLSPAKTEIAV